jgi:hypothetical protein
MLQITTQIIMYNHTKKKMEKKLLLQWSLIVLRKKFIKTQIELSTQHYYYYSK